VRTVTKRFSIFAVTMLWAVCLGSSAASPQNVPTPYLLAGSAEASPSQASPSQPPAPLELNDRPEPLRPKQVRSEAEQDRLEALSLFGAGRMKEQRQDFAGALRSYQRAVRFDPRALPILREIVPLAYNLNRHQVAVQYALKVVELDPSDPILLRQLGLYLTEEGDVDRALRLYEKALAAADREKPRPGDILLRCEAGRLYFLSGKFKEAADAFAAVRTALERPKDFGLDEKTQKLILGEADRTYDLFGDGFLEAGRIPDAVAMFRKADEAAPSQGVLAYNLARVDLKESKPAEALKRLQVYFDAHLDTRGTEPYSLLAKALDALKRPDELVELLEKLRAGDPANVPLGCFLAERYRQAEKLDKAEALYAEIIGRTPAIEAYQGLVDIYRKTDKPEALLKVLGEAASKTDALDALGDPWKAVVQDRALVARLIEAARKQAKADPKALDRAARVAVAGLALETNQTDAAAEFFQLAIQAKPQDAADILLAWGMGLLVQEKYPEAAGVFQRGLDAKPAAEKKSAFYYYLAGALEMAGKTDEALAAARKAVGLNEKSPRFPSRVAWILYHAKRYDEAAKSYAELVEKFEPNHESVEVREVLREARLALSNLCVLRDDLPQAEEWLEQVLDEFPDDISAMNDLGYLWADQGKRLARALVMLQEAVRGEPDNLAYRDSLGWVLFRLGRLPEALAELEKAAKAEKPDGVVLDHLGDVYLKLNQPDKALASWERAAKAYDPRDNARQVKQTAEKIRALKARPGG
jgi:tetratricopeptide (TPR) repeat protein